MFEPAGDVLPAAAVSWNNLEQVRYTSHRFIRGLPPFDNLRETALTPAGPGNSCDGGVRRVKHRVCRIDAANA